MSNQLTYATGRTLKICHLPLVSVVAVASGSCPHWKFGCVHAVTYTNCILAKTAQRVVHQCLSACGGQQWHTDGCSYGRMGGQTDRQNDGRTNIQADGRAGRRTDGRTDGRTDRQTGRQTDRQAGGRAGGRRDRQTDRRAGGRTKGQTDRQPGRRMDGRTDGQTDRQTTKKPDRSRRGIPAW